jgi:hypothetical protein
MLSAGFEPVISASERLQIARLLGSEYNTYFYAAICIVKLELDEVTPAHNFKAFRK